MRGLTQRLVAHAAAVIEPLRPTQARAMTAELVHIDSRGAALSFALGCIAAAYRQRIGVIAALAFSARLGTALAAGLFGLLHITMSWTNVELKLKLMTDPGFAACGPRCSYWVRTVGDLPLGHWAWQGGTLAALGILHLVATALLLRGDTRRLAWAAIATALWALALPLLRGGGITFPGVYVVLMAMMAAMGLGLARLEQWDFARRRTV